MKRKRRGKGGAPKPRKRRTDLTLARAVGERMRDFRLERGLSLVQLHKLGGPSPSHMSSIERGRVDFTVETICVVALALGMRPFQMLADDERLASLDVLDARRILFDHPEFVLPEVELTEPPRAKPWDRIKARKAARKGGV